MRREKNIGYSASSSGVSFSTVHWDLAAHYLNKETTELLVHFAQGLSGIHTVKKSTKTYIFTGRCEHFKTGREIDGSCWWS